MVMFTRAMLEKLDNQLPPLMEGTTSGGGGIIARLCGGRHVDSSGDHDMEGWVERKCRSCIDGGVPAAPPPPEDPKPPATEAAKK
ncbi:hypothetical protein Acr_09g0001070 [Actinidia rufa]|uniref:Uncharacterized protein n=1 Tax=Actinidia rufa TaxID=165716 RepID=A0A7J0F4P4_9ERIC|nr:hypothetical protein Acr_09g0001070 [Actinidia rufa]